MARKTSDASEKAQKISHDSVESLRSRDLVELFKRGETDAATEVFDRYAARLMALAQSRMGQKLRRRVDPEDLVQSAFRSFFLHARKDKYELHAPGDLWRLLAKITLHKLYGQVEKQTAGKRSIDQEAAIDAAAAEVRSPEPTAVETIAAIELLHVALGGLTPLECQAIAGQMRGVSVERISQLIGKSPRTVRRLLAGAREKIERQLLDNAEPPDEARSFVSNIEAPLKFNDFVLEKLVGSGGMGKVFRARDKRTGETVAIKALHKTRQTDHRTVRQFIQEAQILKKLKHPNIVSMQGLGRFPGGSYFMVMDFVDGPNLRTRLCEGPLELFEVISIIQQVATGIQYAHEKGIVHCDLKPENILIDPSGRAVITDFGFAWLMAGEKTSANIGGTAGYIAPEFLSGQSEPTPAADIYGLGMLMWSLLTTQSPKQFALRGLAPNVRPILARCVASQPDDRYLTAGEFLHALNSL